MNNKGFTLIELIMVIALLAVIALLTTPNIIKILEKNKVDNYNSAIDSIISAAEVYVSDNKYNLTFNNNEFCKPSDDNGKNISTNVTLETLINNKYISGELKNHCTNSVINEEQKKSIKVEIILNCGTKNFSYKLLDDSNKEINVIPEGKTCNDI